MAGHAQFKFSAFLSYAHADARWGTWLHKRLEGYKLDRELAGRVTPRGPVPKTLRPIFRDREDFSGGHTLTDATIAALDASAALIAVCSTVAATRPAVNEEVRLFRSRHPGRPVIPVIIEGTYPANFPPALRFALAADGSVTDQPVTILGPDLRKTGDGRTLGLAKIAAGLTGLATDDLHQRLKRQQRRQAWINGVVAACLMVLAGTGGVLYWQKQQLAEVSAKLEKNEQEATALAEALIKANAGQAAAPGQKQDLIASLTQLLQQATAGDAEAARAVEFVKQGKITEAIDLRVAAAEARERHAALVYAQENKKSAQDYREAAALAAVADPGRARALYAKAAQLDPEQIEGLFNHGWFQQQAGNLDEAERAYRRVLALAKVGADTWLYWARLGLGDIQVERGDLGVAKATYREAAAMADRLAKADPGNAGWQRDLSVSYAKLANAYRTAGQLPQAREQLTAGRTIIARLTETYPDWSQWKKDLAWFDGQIAALSK